MSDRLHDTLSALRTDVDHMPLADSSAVRARGTQRTRRQAVGTSLAVVALVAGALGISGALTGSNKADNLPANPTVSTSQTPSPAPTVEKQLDLAADPFLTPKDIGTVGNYEGFQANPDPSAADQQLSLCVPIPATLGAAETQSRMYFSDLDATATAHVLRFADAEEASSAFAGLENALSTCGPGDPAEATVADRPPVPVNVTGADAALQGSRTSTPVQASEVNYFELGVVRKANVVVVLQWSSMGRPTGVNWVWDEARLQTALSRAVG